MMGSREVSGSIDATMRSIDEAPNWQGEGETVWVSPDPEGAERVEQLPDLEADPEPDRQSTLDDWGGGTDVRDD